MAIHTFEYTKVDVDPSPAFPQGYVARRPVLNVTLISGEGRVHCIALADSGADLTTFPLSFLDALGVDSVVAPTGNLASVGSRPLTVFHDIEIEVEGRFRVPLRAGFSQTEAGWNWGLLGMNDFFDFFVSVRFNRDNFELETAD